MAERSAEGSQCARSKAPWSDDDFNTLNDLLRDGWPRRVVALRLGRSVTAIQAMVRKLPMKLMRPATKQVAIQITVSHHAALTQLAKEKNVTLPTLLRLICELSIASPQWAEKLFDDDFAERESQ
jgi:hypothetical protein